MKKTSIFFFLFISFFCLIAIPFVNTTNGAYATVNIVNWDDVSVNSYYGTSGEIDYYRYSYSGTNTSGKVYGSYSVSSPNSYRLDYYNPAYGSDSSFNFTTDYGYIDSCAIYIRNLDGSYTTGSRQYQNIQFYNNTHFLFSISLKQDVGLYDTASFLYDGSIYHWIYSYGNTPAKYYWLIQKVSGINAVNVSMWTIPGTRLGYAISGIAYGVYQTYDQIYLDFNNVGGCYIDMLIDDIDITYGTPPSSGESCELSGYNTFGNLGDSHTASLTGRYLEISYNTRINTSIHAFELYCEKTQYDNMNDLSYYYLYVNCVGMGWPTEWVAYGNGYLLRWCGDIGYSGWPLTVNNERLIFEVACNVAYNTRYWYLFQNYENGLSFRKHNLRSYFGNCLPNGDVVNFYEPCYRFYYGTIVLQGECYDNNIIDAMYKETYYTYTPINLVTQVSSLIYTNYIGVKHGTTWKTNLSLTKCTEVSYYVPEYWGYYNFSLRRNSVFYDDVIIRVVNNSDIKHILYVIPESGSCSGTIHIYYRFYHGNGNDGMIYIKDENGFTFESSLIHDNTSGWVNWTLPNCCVPNTCTHYYDISMYVNTGGLNWSFIKNIQYYLSFEGGHDDIRVLYNPLCLGDDSKGSQSFDINVSLPSMNPRLFLNNNEIFDHLHTGRYNYTITDNKFYVVSIGYKTYKGITYLANASFTATFCNGSIPPSGLIPEIGQPYGMFAGFLLTITCFLFPLFVTKGVLQFNTFIATIISLGSGGMGLCASVILGFIPIWVLAFILFLCILIILIIWLARKIGST